MFLMMMPLPWILVRRRSVDVARWQQASVSATEATAAAWREDRYAGTARDTGPAGFDRVREALLTYTFFPPHRLTGTVGTPDGVIAPGATIVQRVRVGPIGFESGTRVVALDEGSDEAGRRFVRFSYATLAGHPEAGIATFGATEIGDGDVLLTIVTRSRARAWWARLGWPVTRHLQLDTNRRVLERLVAIAEGRDGVDEANVR
jgi:uncharacterized protein (UPF0548 family)